MIPINLPFLPDKNKYQNMISEIFDNRILTNNGPFLRKFEEALKSELGDDNLNVVTNGTIALQLAIKALNLKGKVITTPFSYIATTSSLLWEHCEPIFCDIDGESWNINTKLIEKLITPDVTAFLVTHVFGNSCDIKDLERLAAKYDIKIIYDASHAFGCLQDDRSLVCNGDISTVSFHATKIIHSVEGGLIYSSNLNIHNKVARMRNFGHDGPYKFEEIGINGKNSEVHSAMGLLTLESIEKIILKRKLLYQTYIAGLKSSIQFQRLSHGLVYNYSYMPILLKSEELVLKIITELEKDEIYTRRYFYPSLNELTIVNKQSCPTSEDVSRRILVLPLYYDLKKSEVNEIVSKINRLV